MSVEFSNAYQEILLDNMMAIIKQNFIFQTQLKLNEDIIKNNQEIEKQFNELKTNYQELNNLFIQTKNDLKQVEVYKIKAEQSNSIQEEKNRIQSALNDTMKKYAILEKNIEEKNINLEKLQKEIFNLKNVIQNLEQNIPPTKLKKINLQIENNTF